MQSGKLIQVLRCRETVFVDQENGICGGPEVGILWTLAAQSFQYEIFVVDQKLDFYGSKLGFLWTTRPDVKRFVDPGSPEVASPEVAAQKWQPSSGSPEVEAQSLQCGSVTPA